MWGEKEPGKTWEYIYFVDNIRMLNIDKEKFHKEVGYSENYTPEWLKRVAKEHIRRNILQFVENIGNKGNKKGTPNFINFQKAR